MTGAEARQAICEARDEFERRAKTAPRGRAVYRLAARFARHELAHARPAQLPAVLASLRIICRGALAIEQLAA